MNTDERGSRFTIENFFYCLGNYINLYLLSPLMIAVIGTMTCGLSQRQRLFSRPLRCYVNVKKENRPPFVFLYVSAVSGASLFLQSKELSIAPERSP